eukprot:scaffold154694_cov31-Attheya_sp.AAC.1
MKNPVDGAPLMMLYNYFDVCMREEPCRLRSLSSCLDKKAIRIDGHTCRIHGPIDLHSKVPCNGGRLIIYGGGHPIVGDLGCGSAMSGMGGVGMVG